MSNRIGERLARRARQRLGGTWVKDAYLASWHGLYGPERVIRRRLDTDGNSWLIAAGFVFVTAPAGILIGELTKHWSGKIDDPVVRNSRCGAGKNLRQSGPYRHGAAEKTIPTQSRGFCRSHGRFERSGELAHSIADIGWY